MFFVNKDIIKKIFMFVILAVFTGIVVYAGFFLYKEKFVVPVEKDLSEMNNMEVLGAVYEHIFNDVMDKGKYERSPIIGFENSMLFVEDGKVRVGQQDYVVARYWDFIFATYLYGSETGDQELVDRANDGRDYLYANAVPFAKGPHSLSTDEMVDHMSTPNKSVCYPLKFKDFFSEEYEDFFSSSCRDQYMDAENVAFPCYKNGTFTAEDLEDFLDILKSFDVDDIRDFMDKHDLVADDLGDKAVDYFILQDYIVDLVVANKAEWDDWDFSEIDYDSFKAEIEGTIDISTDEENLGVCLKTNGYRSIAQALVNIYENAVVVEGTVDSEVIGFSRIYTYPLINTLSYLKQSEYVTRDESIIIGKVATFLADRPTYYVTDYSYDHGAADVALLELCLSEGLKNYEVDSLDPVTVEKYGDSECPYMDDVYERFVNGTCNSGECQTRMLFNLEYEGDDGVKRYQANSADTLRAVFDLILLENKYDIND